MSHTEDNAAILLAYLEANPGLHQQYPELADAVDLSIPAVQKAYQYLCATYKGANLIIPAPYNGYITGLALIPDRPTLQGIANQAKHLQTRLGSQANRSTVAGKTSADRRQKRVLNGYAKMVTGIKDTADGAAEMLDAFAESHEDRSE